MMYKFENADCDECGAVPAYQVHDDKYDGGWTHYCLEHLPKTYSDPDDWVPGVMIHVEDFKAMQLVINSSIKLFSGGLPEFGDGLFELVDAVKAARKIKC